MILLGIVVVFDSTLVALATGKNKVLCTLQWTRVEYASVVAWTLSKLGSPAKSLFQTRTIRSAPR